MSHTSETTSLYKLSYKQHRTAWVNLDRTRWQAPAPNVYSDGHDSRADWP
jgi:hypothetical protein